MYNEDNLHWGTVDDFLNKLSSNVRKHVDVLREIQGKNNELEKKYLEERAALDAKYQKLHEALFTKRCNIVNGVTELEVETNEVLQDKEGDKEKGIPNFWLIAMKNNHFLNLKISEKDEGALKYLKDIKCSRTNGPNAFKSFKLEFLFDSNPYFMNPVLIKTYITDGDEDIGFSLKQAIGTEIEWYAGKRLNKSKEESSSTNPIIKTENCRSFFDFFNTSINVDDVEDMQDEDHSKLLMAEIHRDYSIGKTIRDKLIPNAVSWFTTEACLLKNTDDTKPEDDGGDDNDGDGDGDEDEEEDYNDDNDGDEEEDYDDDDGDKEEDDSDDTDTRQKKMMKKSETKEDDEE